MALPDLVQEVLDYLDANWDTSNFSPKPILVDGDEMRINADDSPADALDVVNTNIITVDSSPSGSNTAIGTEYDHQVRHGVNVQIEGYHEAGGGQITNKDEFNSLVAEARRTILLERTFPVGGMTDLRIEAEDDESAAQNHNDANYFRYLFDVWFEGYEDLS